MSPDFIDWKETNKEDKIEYYSDRKHGIIEIFCRVKLPYKFYEIANALSIIYDLKSFDHYISSLVYNDIENYIHNGTDIIGDAILNNVTGEKTYWHSAEEEEESKSEKDYVNVRIDSDIAERLVKVEERKKEKQRIAAAEDNDENVARFVKVVLDNSHEVKKSEDREKESLK